MKQPTKTSHTKATVPKSKRKSREQLNAQARDRKRQKKHRGHKAGSRTQPVSANKQVEKDPRIGSKIAVPLLIANNVTETKISARKMATKLTVVKSMLPPEEELSQLENDERLDKLLNRIDSKEILSKEDQVYVELTLDRISSLMEKLGIDLDDNEAQGDMLQLLQRR